MTLDVKNFRAALDDDGRPELVVVRKWIAASFHFRVDQHRPGFIFDAGFEGDTVQTPDQLHLLSAETLVSVFDFNLGRRFSLTVYVRFEWEKFFSRDFGRRQDVFNPNIMVRPHLRRNG